MSILDTLRPVDSKRIEHALNAADLAFGHGPDDSMILAFPSAMVSISVSSLESQGKDLIQIIGRWRESVDASWASELADFALVANRELESPKVILVTENTSGSYQSYLGTTLSFYVPGGITDKQLHSFINNGVTTTLQLFKRATLTMGDLFSPEGDSND